MVFVMRYKCTVIPIFPVLKLCHAFCPGHMGAVQILGIVNLSATQHGSQLCWCSCCWQWYSLLWRRHTSTARASLSPRMQMFTNLVLGACSRAYVQHAGTTQ